MPRGCSCGWLPTPCPQAARTEQSSRDPGRKINSQPCSFQAPLQRIKNKLALALSLGEELWAWEPGAPWGFPCVINPRTGSPIRMLLRGPRCQPPSLPVSRDAGLGLHQGSPREEGQWDPEAKGGCALCRVRDPGPAPWAEPAQTLRERHTSPPTPCRGGRTRAGRVLYLPQPPHSPAGSGDRAGSGAALLSRPPGEGSHSSAPNWTRSRHHVANRGTVCLLGVHSMTGCPHKRPP